jgi:hypothetical protein
MALASRHALIVRIFMGFSSLNLSPNSGLGQPRLSISLCVHTYVGERRVTIVKDIALALSQNLCQ